MNNKSYNKFLATHVLEAVYNWAIVHECTPQILVSISPSCVLPLDSYNMDELVLNISALACRNLVFENDFCLFTTRFNTLVFDVKIPVLNIVHIAVAEKNFVLNVKPFLDMISADELAQYQIEEFNENKKQNSPKIELKVVGGSQKSLNNLDNKQYSLGLQDIADTEESHEEKRKTLRNTPLKLKIIDGGKK